MTPTREDAWKLLQEYVKSESLVRHCLTVEAAMRAYAVKYGGDPEMWGMAGLLHDFDYEKFPHPDPVQKTGHPFEGVKVLKEKGYPEEIIQAILGHAMYSGTPRETMMAKCLFACDELCGFIVAVARMRPDNLAGITPDTVRKYLKKKKFAEKVSREEIRQGVEELPASPPASSSLGGELQRGEGIPEDEHITLVIKALQGISKELGF